MASKSRKIGGTAVIVILLLITYVIGSELYYLQSISPRGVSTVHDFFERFGEPRRIRMIQRGGQSYYEFSGFSRRRLPVFVVAMPSGPPAYVFDEHGQFTTWCSDPGDVPSYRATWPLQSTNQVETGTVKERFGLR
jgi:hypothetical protein